jgi:MATE family multidrug resistance protein
MITSMTKWQHARALLVLGLPLVGSHLAQFGVHVTDTVMLGWYGVNELASVVIGGNFWFIIFIVGSGFAAALPAIVASAMAKKDEVQVRRATRMAFWLSLIYATVMLPVFLFAEAILLAAGQDAEVARLAGDYLIIAGWGVYPSLMIMVLKSYLSALERTGVVLWVTVGAAVAHIFTNWVLIFGKLGFPEMGVQGAAVSTLMTETVACLILARYAVRNFPEHDLFARFWRPDNQAMAQIFALGWPIGLTMLAEVGLFAAAALMMGSISPIALAAHGIALQLAAFAFLIHLGLSNAATIRAGQAEGQGDIDALREGALAAVLLSLCIALAASLIFAVFAEPLLSVFLDPTDPDTPAVIAVGIGLLYFAAVFQLADGGQATAIGLLRGIQDTKVPMYLAIFCYWCIGLPVAYGLGFGLGWGGSGIWSGLVIGLVTVWISLSARFWLVGLRRMRVRVGELA